MNHEILGIHCDGNDFSVDEQGFLYIPDSTGFDSFANKNMSFALGAEQRLLLSTKDKVRELKRLNNCWICEG